MHKSLLLAVTVVAATLLFACAPAEQPAEMAEPEMEATPMQSSAPRVFELRTYTANEGKMEALQARFRDHALTLFENHGMTSIGYWVATDEPNTFIYVLAHASREAAEASWEAFFADPEWQRVKAESEVDGPLVSNVVSVFMEPTDFSPLK